MRTLAPQLEENGTGMLARNNVRLAGGACLLPAVVAEHLHRRRPFGTTVIDEIIGARSLALVAGSSRGGHGAVAGAECLPALTWNGRGVHTKGGEIICPSSSNLLFDPPYTFLPHLFPLIASHLVSRTCIVASIALGHRHRIPPGSTTVLPCSRQLAF